MHIEKNCTFSSVAFALRSVLADHVFVFPIADVAVLFLVLFMMNDGRIYMDGFIDILKSIQSVVWGPITLILLVGTGLYFTIRLGFLQIIRLLRVIRYIFEKEEGVEGNGDVSAFASLCTTLAATIGTGSIVGVATALRTGGPGALFWMWVSAFVGMTTKYAEGVLAVKYRTVDENEKSQAALCTIFKTVWARNGFGWQRFLLYSE